MNGRSITDDFFVEQTEKSAIKSAIVYNFFKVYIRIINAKFNKKIYYIDLFSGPGKYDDGTASTPIHILNAIKAYDNSLLIQCVFNERDKEYFDKLKNNVINHEAYNNLAYKPVITNVDAADVDLSQYLKGNVPAFSFVDPFGYKGTSVEQIWQLVHNVGSDCVFFFNANRIIMDFDKPNKDRDFTKLFGGYYDKLSKEIQNCPSHYSKMKLVLNAFTMNLQNIVYKQRYNFKLFVLPFGFSFDDRIKDSHYLLFISKNHKAVMEMKRVMARFSNSISEMYSYDSKTVNQLSLFNIEDDGYNNFCKAISDCREELEGKHYKLESFGERLDELSMERYHKVTPFSIQDIKKFLRRHYDEGFIISCDAFKPREIFADNRVFKFKDN